MSVREFVSLSVRLSVHKRFFDFNEIWHVGRELEIDE